MEGLIQTLPFVVDAGMRGDLSADIFEVGGRTPTRIIRTTQTWEVRVDWELRGPVVPFGNPASSWRLTVNLESMGGGPEFQPVPTVVVPYIAADPAVYSAVVPIPAAPGPPDAGIAYRVVVSLVYYLAGGAPGNMAGFVDLGLVHFYT